ncbi:uncharacterized protein I206_105989 [Kwoniella pini CBS 10737]|uniref:RanBP2-type domain-containing protein n=1 Tax=Kwoniella pini CBS 10737 TaxID=1296096 RepID=A0A1B9I0T4_9TREE|nr:uncharacterized protein I206_04812 [Kwoniella pini CBS 10737]OCF49125.1 hypothetical protein I206_04812 [Kwoniella pini CBS 10737]
MERSSSQRDLRAERIARTPYNRPEPSRLRKSASMTPLATLKSIVSYVSSPFTKSSSSVLPTHTDDGPLRIADVDQDTKSESGSEDEWNGEPPSQMNGQDIFTLAAAAGRSGQQFEDRAITWRTNEVPGGRRQLARLALEGSSSAKALEPAIPTAPGHFDLVKSSPSMPSLSKSVSSPLRIPQSRTSRTKSPLSSNENTHLPQRGAIPDYSTPHINQTQGLSSSASSVALTAFLEAKKGQLMTTDDFRVIESLTENMKAESQFGGSPTKSEFSQTQTPNQVKSRGGWAAGSYPSGIRSSNSFASLNTPNKANQASTPGKVFSIGSTPNISGGSPYRQRYLGPGMSPRRLLPQPKKSNLKPLFNFGASTNGEDLSDELKGKKQKVADEDEISMDIDSNTTPSTANAPGLSSSVSMPSLSASTKGNSKLSVPTHTPAKSSPLSRDSSSPYSTGENDEKAKRKREAELAGKKRAAEIIMDIIDEEIGPIIPTRKAEPVIFNPYDRTSLNPSTVPAVPSTQPSTAFAGSTPRKSLTRSINGKGSPARRTPTRGAAAKLELHKEAMRGSKALTTIERIQGVRPWEKGESSSRNSRVETPIPDDDEIEIDELVDESQASSSRAPSPAPSVSAPASSKNAASTAKTPTAETFKPFTTPSITFNNQPLPKSPAPTPSSESFDSPLTKSIITASTSSSENIIPKPTFSFGKTSTTPDSIEKIDSTKEPKSKSPEKEPTPKLDTSKIYLSAKDSALKIAQPALPFFTFTLPRPMESTPSPSVLEESKKRKEPSFEFTLPSSKSEPQSEEKDWNCGLCGLKNPGSAKEKCTICEEPKPKFNPQSQSAVEPLKSFQSSISTQGFSLGQFTNKSGGKDWMCDVCMLMNPDSVKDKCTICEAPKPASKSSTNSSTFGTTTSGFGQTQAPKASGEWQCNLCMLKNPDSAKEKCQICDAPRP